MQNSKVEDTYFSANKHIRIGDKLIDVSTPMVMGIVNTTPDSFYSGSRTTKENDGFERVKEMLTDGAGIIDVGGYSSRPGATNISEEEEIKRVVPLIGKISNEFPDAIISIDTFRASVAERAIQAGAHIINDISGFEIDPKIAEVAATYNVPYILMHMRGTPENMQNDTDYSNLFVEMMQYFTQKLTVLSSLGVHDVIIDPGFGFGKDIDQNYFLLNHMDAFQCLNRPLLAGVSRKSMIYKKLSISPEEALNGTIALNTIALQKGAAFLRVHDVKEAWELIRLTR